MENQQLTHLSQVPSVPLSMTSQEIASTIKKRHDHVLRDIDKILEDLPPNLGAGFKSSTYLDVNGRDRRIFVLDRDSTYCLMAGYDATARMKIVKRWQELESRASVPALSTTEVEAVRENIRIGNLVNKKLNDVVKRLGVCEGRDYHLYNELERISSKLLEFETRPALPAPSPVMQDSSPSTHDAIEDIYHELRVLKAAFSSIQSDAHEALEKIDTHLDSRHGNSY